MTLYDIASSIAVIISIVAIIMAYRKAPHEESNLDADTAKTYEETAALSAERANRLEKHVETLTSIVESLKKQLYEKGLLLDELTGRDNETRNRVSALELENSELIERVRILESENGDLREWVSKLVMQVKNLGGTPVAFRGGKKS